MVWVRFSEPLHGLGGERMYWWNAERLAEDFREGRVDEKEQFKYYLATSVAWTILALLFFFSGVTFRFRYLFFSALILFLTVFGIVRCYNANKKGDNTDFIARMVCLGWPVGIRIATLMASLCLVFGAIKSLPSAAYGPSSFLSAVPNGVLSGWTQLDPPVWGYW
jgi:hypothetical protein